MHTYRERPAEQAERLCRSDQSSYAAGWGWRQLSSLKVCDHQQDHFGQLLQREFCLPGAVPIWTWPVLFRTWKWLWVNFMAFCLEWVFLPNWIIPCFMILQTDCKEIYLQSRAFERTHETILPISARDGHKLCMEDEMQLAPEWQILARCIRWANHHIALLAAPFVQLYLVQTSITVLHYRPSPLSQYSQLPQTSIRWSLAHRLMILSLIYWRAHRPSGTCFARVHTLELLYKL